MDNLPKIECKTEEIIRSKKNGKTYKTIEDFLKENIMEDLQKDLFVKISPEGLSLMQKIMNKK
jgi:hypothetical protein